MVIQLRLGGVHKLRLQDLAFFDHLPPSVYIFYGIKVYKKSIFLTTYPPPLVNVVCERSLWDLINLLSQYFHENGFIPVLVPTCANLGNFDNISVEYYVASYRQSHVWKHLPKVVLNSYLIQKIYLSSDCWHYSYWRISDQYKWLLAPIWQILFSVCFDCEKTELKQLIIKHIREIFLNLSKYYD